MRRTILVGASDHRSALIGTPMTINNAFLYNCIGAGRRCHALGRHLSCVRAPLLHKAAPRPSCFFSHQAITDLLIDSSPENRPCRGLPKYTLSK